MKRKQLLETAPCPEPGEHDPEHVTAASQAVSVDGRDVLNVDLFWQGRLQARYFADREKEEYASFIYGVPSGGKHQGWTRLSLGNTSRVARGKEAYDPVYTCIAGQDIVWASEKDKQRARELLDTYSLESWEAGVNGRKRIKAARRKQERINGLMDAIPEVPGEAGEWVKDEIFPGHFLFVKKGKKRFLYSCTCCGASGWKKAGWKHNELTECPKCGHKARVYRRGQEVKKRDRVTILQKADSRRWTERIFKVQCTWDRSGKRVELYAEICAVMGNGKQWGDVYYGQSQDADEYQQEWWDRNTVGKRWGRSYLWPGNLEEVLPVTGLKNMGLDILAEKKERFEVNTFIITAEGRPYLEYMIKGGFTRMAADILSAYSRYWEPEESFINIGAKKATEVLNLDGNRVDRLRNLNGGIEALRWLQYEKKREDTGSPARISRDTLDWLGKVKLEQRDCEEILQELGSVNRMANYMKKQETSPKMTAITWRDYLRMARDEGMDTADDIVRFPRDLKARHDQLVELGNQRADEERLKGYAKLDAEILKRLPEAARYYWEDDRYTIIPAGKCEELMAEGRALHHCVGRDDHYMKKMAEGKSWILFLRKKEDLEKAYYTIEIRMEDDRIVQCYSEYDRKPDTEEIRGVLERFRKSIKRDQEVRILVQAAVPA